MSVARDHDPSLDGFYRNRPAWRRPDADPHALGRAGQVLWVFYAPARSIRERLTPRGHADYPPRTPLGRVRWWLVHRL